MLIVNSGVNLAAARVEQRDAACRRAECGQGTQIRDRGNRLASGFGQSFGRGEADTHSRKGTRTRGNSKAIDTRKAERCGLRKQSLDLKKQHLREAIRGMDAELGDYPPACAKGDPSEFRRCVDGQDRRRFPSGIFGPARPVLRRLDWGHFLSANTLSNSYTFPFA